MYLPRVADAKVERYLRLFGAVVTGVSGYAWQAGEHAYVIPIAALAP